MHISKRKECIRSMICRKRLKDNPVTSTRTPKRMEGTSMIARSEKDITGTSAAFKSFTGA